jgi:hypothetical protein
MKPASIFNLLDILGQISEAEQLNAEQVKYEIEKANSIEDLAEALASITKPKCCRQETDNGVRMSENNLSFPSVNEGTFSFVLSTIEVVRNMPSVIHIYTSGHIFSFGKGYIELAPSVFKRLTEYFTD